MLLVSSGESGVTAVPKIARACGAPAHKPAQSGDHEMRKI